MIPVQYIIIACWAIFALYWFISASSVKSTQETKGWLAGNWHSIWLIIGGLFLSNVPFLAKVGVSISALTILLIHELITTSLYRYVRHPIYTGVLLMVLATALFVGTLSAAIGFIIIVLGLWFKLRAEEKLLTKHFPKEYPAYKERTKALIPYVV